MATLEQELIEKVSKLDREQQYRVLGYVDGLLQPQQPKPQMTLGEWAKLADEALQEFRAKYGENVTVDIQSILDEIREEPTDERLGRS